MIAVVPVPSVHGLRKTCYRKGSLNFELYKGSGTDFWKDHTEAPDRGRTVTHLRSPVCSSCTDVAPNPRSSAAATAAAWPCIKTLVSHYPSFDSSTATRITTLTQHIHFHPHTNMAPFASGAPGQVGPGISPKLMIAIVGCLVLFLAIVIGFCLVARKMCCAPRPSASDHPECHHHHRPPARRGIAQPVASSTKCLACQKSHSEVGKASRVSQDSLRSPPPPPYYARRGPTGVSRVPSSRSASSSTTPTTPPSPPPVYVARGPTAILRPLVF